MNDNMSGAAMDRKEKGSLHESGNGQLKGSELLLVSVCSLMCFENASLFFFSFLAELYFLISRFLTTGPCRRAAEVRELLFVFILMKLCLLCNLLFPFKVRSDITYYSVLQALVSELDEHQVCMCVIGHLFLQFAATPSFFFDFSFPP